MIIPPEQLIMESLRGVVESVIMREGTDYGEHEFSMEEKIEQLLPKVVSGEVVISFDEDSETVTLVEKHAMAEMKNATQD